MGGCVVSRHSPHARTHARRPPSHPDGWIDEDKNRAIFFSHKQQRCHFPRPTQPHHFLDVVVVLVDDDARGALSAYPLFPRWIDRCALLGFPT
jgi:hypothetical protein